MPAITHCKVCCAPLPPPYLDLGNQPPANNLVAMVDHSTGEGSATYPLAVTVCSVCDLSQLTYAVDPETLFSHYLYTPSQGNFFKQHFKQMAEDLIRDLALLPGDRVVDIGSNDGLLLSYFQDAGMLVTGVEPAQNLAAAANKAGIPTLNLFWGKGALPMAPRSANLITATNVFAHVENLHEFVSAVEEALTPQGTFVFEVAGLLEMVNHGTIDLVYHEHLYYWSLSPLHRLFELYGLTLIDIKPVPSHGGSIRVFVQRAGSGDGDSPSISRIFDRVYDEARLADRAIKELPLAAQAIHASLRWQLASLVGKKVVGYGAPAKATVLVNYCSFTSRSLSYIVDDNPLKQGHYIPGSDIPIYGSEQLTIDPPDAVLIFPWNVASDIRPKLEALGITNIIVPFAGP